MILRTLCFQNQPIPLRHVAYISNLPVFSVQRAIEPLTDDKIIIKLYSENNVLFKINTNNTLYNLLMQFFIMEMNNTISMESAKYSEKAKDVLEFTESANIILKETKRNDK